MHQYQKTNASEMENNRTDSEEILKDDPIQFPPAMEKVMQTYLSYLEQFPDAILKNYESLDNQTTDVFGIFNPEILQKVCADSLEGVKNTFLEEPEKWEMLQKQYLSDLESLFQKSIDQFDGQNVDPVITPEKMIGDSKMRNGKKIQFLII